MGWTARASVLTEGRARGRPHRKKKLKSAPSARKSHAHAHTHTVILLPRPTSRSAHLARACRTQPARVSCPPSRPIAPPSRRRTSPMASSAGAPAADDAPLHPLPRRPLGNTGLNVSVIGFGASPLGSVFEVRECGAKKETPPGCFALTDLALVLTTTAPPLIHSLTDDRRGRRHRRRRGSLPPGHQPVRHLALLRRDQERGGE
jgi:hypothetical protein